MPMQTISYLASFIVIPDSDYSPISQICFEVLLLQMRNKTVAAKKKRKRIVVSSMMITSEEWIKLQKKILNRK